MSTLTVDRRRNAGPEISARPIPDPNTLQNEKRPILNEELVRLDGRYPEQLRPFSISTGVIKRAPGSSYIESGNTKLFCSVYGPRNPTSRTVIKSFQKYGNVSCEVNFAPFSALQRCPHQPEAEEENLALLVLQSVVPAIRRDLFPNSFLDIYITILERDGSLLSASIMAASTALIQAGVEMMDSIVSCTLLHLPQKNRMLLVDPNTEEESNESGKIVVAFMPNLNMMSQFHLIGQVESQIINEAVSMGMDACRAIYENAIYPTLSNLS